MSSARLDIRHRPLKLGFLVNPYDKKEIEAAIRAACKMWGGLFNPLIPVIDRASKSWKAPFETKKTGKEITKGYIEYFDPDYLVDGKPTTEKEKWDVTRGKISINSLSESGNLRSVLYGISIFDVVEYYFRQELKFVRRDPIKFVFPKVSGKYSFFLNSVFGCLDKEVEDEFHRYFGKALGIETKECDLSNYHEFLDPSNHFIRRLTGIEIQKKSTNRREFLLHLIDAEKAQDVLDFWNLRAAGNFVIPLPIQAQNEPSVLNYIVELLKPYAVEDEKDSDLFRRPTIIKGRGISTQELNSFIDAVTKAFTPLHEKRPRLVIQNWYPSIWNSSSTELNRWDCSDFEYSSQKVHHDNIPTKLAFITPAIPILSKHSAYGHAHFASELEYRFYGSTELLAEVIPELKNTIARKLGSFESKDWRFSKNGIVHYARHTDWQVEIEVPTAEKVFTSWMSEKGWSVEISVPGKAGTQMLKYLGGIFGVGKIMNHRILKVLSEMSGDRHKTASEITGVAKQIINESEWKGGTAEGVIGSLTGAKVLSLGVEIQCLVCSQRSWYSLTEFNYSLKCPKCFSDFAPPIANPRAIQWAYKSIGPFNAPQQAYGMYTALLALRFFSLALDQGTTSMLSFTAKKGEISIEADLGILFRKERYDWQKGEPKVLFAECKTFNDFKEEDFDRMRMIAENFPGAYIVFATQKNVFTPFEIKSMRTLANFCRKYSPNYLIRNRVLILTGDQLLSHDWPPDEWKSKAEPFKSVSRVYTENLIDHICDVTQQIFLDMEPMDSWQQKEFEKRRKRTSEKTKTV